MIKNDNEWEKFYKLAHEFKIWLLQKYGKIEFPIEEKDIKYSEFIKDKNNRIKKT